MTAANALIVAGTLTEIRPGRVLSLAVHDGGSGTTIFFCHGAGGAKNQWRNQWQALAALGHRLIAWDYPGHGETPPTRNAADYAGEAFVAHYLALIDRFAGPRNLLVGHSYGTRLTLNALIQLVARPAPPVVAGAVLLGAPPPIAIVPKGPIVSWPVWLLKLMRPVLSKGFRRLAWDDAADPALVAYETAQSDRNSLFMMKWLMKQFAPIDAAKLGTLTLPIHILAGASDGLTPPAAGEALAKALPHASFTSLPATGHQIMLERPEETTGAILSALG